MGKRTQGIMFVTPEMLPRKAEYGGYVYILVFTDGRVKVGLSTNPKARAESHRATAAALGNPLAQGWFSPRHDDFTQNEQRLIALAASLGGCAIGAEYFTGVSFDDLLTLAQRRLRFAPVDVQAHLDRMAAGKDSAREFFAALDESAELCVSDGKSLLDRNVERLHDVVGRWFGRDGDTYRFGLPSGPTSLPWQMVEKLAESRGRGLQAVLDMDSFDITKALLCAVVEEQALQARLHAIRTGRDDLIATIGQGLAEGLIADAAAERDT